MELFRNKEKGNVCPVFVKGGRELGLTASGCIVYFPLEMIIQNI